ncbi:phosphate ABC transporter substrate-binding protein [Novipirellula rosea]|uniref:Phosphate ABC transporter substrate-binding protein n=1 Tax=Novipirellula rosea TaxID=1031540 RepID=A0ABP8MNH5_9BACT
MSTEEHPRSTRVFSIGVLALLPLVIVSCSTNSVSDNTNQLELSGSSTIAPLAAKIAARFESMHSEVRVNVQGGGSSRGITDARRGLVDIGMVSRDLKSEEQDLTAFTIARDGIAVIVHRENPITSLTNNQIAAIYTGDIKDWRDVGGTAGPITIVNKAEGRSTLELFTEYIQVGNRHIKADVVIADNEQGIKTVAGNPGAIGYVSIGSAEYDAAAGVAIKLLPLAGVAASIENVRNGSFPLTRPLNLVVKQSPTPRLQAFLEFARSSDVHDIIEAQYFVPLAR